MSKNQPQILFLMAQITLTLTLIASVWAANSKELKSLAPTFGIYPYGEVISDAKGNLYATASAGGGLDGQDHGTVFILRPNVNGSWSQSALFAFGVPMNDGGVPESDLIFDAQGNLYGTTTAGGLYGMGTVFELTPSSHGYWTEALLHSFSGSDGSIPNDLLLDAQGNLYGTTRAGGSAGDGVIFEFSPVQGGGYAYTVLYSFQESVGSTPLGSLVQDSGGNLYGTTSAGGQYENGTVFELSPIVGGGWVEATIHNFGGNQMEGINPIDGLVIDSSGNLYGTTCSGGSYLYGTAFELSLMGNGVWTEQIIHSFGLSKSDGHCPLGLARDASGNVYGTTVSGGTSNQGTVFELSPSGDGQWVGKILHTFQGKADGANPHNGLILDQFGNLYGTTTLGGPSNGGIVYEITP